METGWWLMSARLAYKKLMLYHNIITSDDKRVTKKLIQVQKEEGRRTTWYSGIESEIHKYGIELNAETTLKSSWKKHVKQKINKEMERNIRSRCGEMSKGRTVKNDDYQKKDYLSKVSLEEAKKIMRVRMHMCKLPGNYKEGGDGLCLLCKEEKGSTEHYFACNCVAQLRKVWRVKKDDMKSKELDKMRDVASFMEKVEEMLQPMMEKKKPETGNKQSA